MTVKRLLFNLLSLTVLVLVIYYGGTHLSNRLGKVYKSDIEKHGAVVAAVVTNKKYLKGYYVVFSYDYKGTRYSNKEQNRDYYDDLNINEAIEVKIDTTSPEDSYIFATKSR